MANIHSFESLAAVDGEGLRFDIFFTGCPPVVLIVTIPTLGVRAKSIWKPMRFSEK